MINFMVTWNAHVGVYHDANTRRVDVLESWLMFLGNFLGYAEAGDSVQDCFSSALSHKALPKYVCQPWLVGLLPHRDVVRCIFNCMCSVWRAENPRRYDRTSLCYSSLHFSYKIPIVSSTPLLCFDRVLASMWIDVALGRVTHFWACTQFSALPSAQNSGMKIQGLPSLVIDVSPRAAITLYTSHV